MRPDFWYGKKVFITGNTGFKGSWLALWLYRRGAFVRGYALKPPTKPSMHGLCRMDDLFRTITADVRDYKALNAAIREFRPDAVFHLAAQPLVLKSYDEPLLTYSTNVLGTANVLEAAYRARSVKAVVNVTSDKCYDNDGRSVRRAENDRLGGTDPYSSSKACAELVGGAYQKSFYSLVRGKGLASARAGNVIGGGDWAENRLLPDFFRAALSNSTMLVRNPAHIRPWQHVLEPLGGYLLLAEKLFREPAKYSGPWNFGPASKDSRTVREVMALARKNWGPGAEIRTTRSSGPHEAPRLELDASKAARALGWKPRWSLETSVLKTVEWFKAYEQRRDMRDFSLSQIAEFESR